MCSCYVLKELVNMPARRRFSFEKSANVRTVVLILVGVVYLLLGSVIFRHVEREYEETRSNELDEYENELKSRYNITGKDYDNLTRIILEQEPYKAGIQWSYIGALYFAITVVTTIGYGHAVPQTDTGKIVCIFYAIFGVPLCLVMFQAMGERINTGAKNSLKLIGNKLGCIPNEVSHKCLVPFGILTCCITVAVGSSAFHYFESWSYIQSVYYCVMTLTTIGFGDYVALQNNSDMQNRPEYVAFSFIYIMIGLTVIGAFLNLVILRLMVTLPSTPDGSTNGDGAKEELVLEDNASCSCTERSAYDAESQAERTSSNQSQKGLFGRNEKKLIHTNRTNVSCSSRNTLSEIRGEEYDSILHDPLLKPSETEKETLDQTQGSNSCYSCVVSSPYRKLCCNSLCFSETPDVCFRHCTKPCCCFSVSNHTCLNRNRNRSPHICRDDSWWKQLHCQCSATERVRKLQRSAPSCLSNEQEKLQSSEKDIQVNNESISCELKNTSNGFHSKHQNMLIPNVTVSQYSCSSLTTKQNKVKDTNLLLSDSLQPPVDYLTPSWHHQSDRCLSEDSGYLGAQSSYSHLSSTKHSQEIQPGKNFPIYPQSSKSPSSVCEGKTRRRSVSFTLGDIKSLLDNEKANHKTLKQQASHSIGSNSTSMHPLPANLTNKFQSEASFLEHSKAKQISQPIGKTFGKRIKEFCLARGDIRSQIQLNVEPEEMPNSTSDGFQINVLNVDEDNKENLSSLSLENVHSDVTQNPKSTSPPSIIVSSLSTSKPRQKSESLSYQDSDDTTVSILINTDMEEQPVFENTSPFLNSLHNQLPTTNNETMYQVDKIIPTNKRGSCSREVNESNSSSKDLGKKDYRERRNKTFHQSLLVEEQELLSRTNSEPGYSRRQEFCAHHFVNNHHICCHCLCHLTKNHFYFPVDICGDQNSDTDKKTHIKTCHCRESTFPLHHQSLNNTSPMNKSSFINQTSCKENIRSMYSCSLCTWSCSLLNKKNCCRHFSKSHLVNFSPLPARDNTSQVTSSSDSDSEYSISHKRRTHRFRRTSPSRKNQWRKTCICAYSKCNLQYKKANSKTTPDGNEASFNKRSKPKELSKSISDMPPNGAKEQNNIKLKAKRISASARSMQQRSSITSNGGETDVSIESSISSSFL